MYYHDVCFFFFLCLCTRFRPEGLLKLLQSWKVSDKKWFSCYSNLGHFLNFTTVFQINEENLQQLQKNLTNFEF
jgi:hypothetical protein